jgi:hypothetical protein
MRKDEAMNDMTSKNAQELINKLKNDQLRLYFNPNQGPNFINEIAFQDYLNYKSFLKTGIFHNIAFKHIAKIEKKSGIQNR